MLYSVQVKEQYHAFYKRNGKVIEKQAVHLRAADGHDGFRQGKGTDMWNTDREIALKRSIQSGEQGAHNKDV